MKKTFKIELELQENNTPQNWTFSAGISPIEQLALWMIVKKLAESQMDKMLNNGKH